jgi:hypothetical protein
MDTLLPRAAALKAGSLLAYIEDYTYQDAEVGSNMQLL